LPEVMPHRQCAFATALPNTPPSIPCSATMIYFFQ
jgi:hypothetical protein